MKDNLLLRLRFSSDANVETIIEWRGSIFAFLPGQTPQLVFKCVGMNIAKAHVADGKLFSTCRELLYYLDPKSGQKLTHWINPWTNERLPVVHIANNPVQMALPCSVPLDIRSEPFNKTTKVVSEIPLFYPNPLADGTGKFDAYDPEPMYQAGELFTFSCPTAELDEPAIQNVQVNWTRVSRFPPFMKMGGKTGYLIYHCEGYKLPPGIPVQDKLLAHEISTSMTAYAHAPAQYDPNVKNVTSWTYFKEYIDRYESEKEAEWPVPDKE